MHVVVLKKSVPRPSSVGGRLNLGLRICLSRVEPCLVMGSFVALETGVPADRVPFTGDGKI